jgi:predicted Zn finger-like uncharacterized protein
VIIQCDSCLARYRYDESRFEGQASKKVRCTKCLAVFEVANPIQAAASEPEKPSVRTDDTFTRTPEEGGRSAVEKTARTRLTTEERKKAFSELKLPEDAKLSLAVISGPHAGRIFPIEKPKMIIGREDADVSLDDPEVSRQHAAIEVAGDRITLLDLASTNGTLVGDEPVAEANLENQSEFTVGGSTLMLIITRGTA